MESKAIARYIHQSPFKVRKTLDSVKGMSVENALNYLHFSKEKAAKIIEKTIRSAVSNLLNENENAVVDQGSLKLKEGVYVVNVNCVSIYEMLDCDFILVEEESYNKLIQNLMR